MRRLAAIPCIALLLTVACSDGLGTAGGPGSTTVIIDPETGDPIEVPVDPVTGKPLDPVTGQPLDPVTGKPISPTLPTDPSQPATPLADCDTPGPRLIRRLTAAQYENTLVRLLGEGFPTETVLTDPPVLGFHVDADQALVAGLTAELLMNYAEKATTWAIQNQPGRLASCQTHETACHEQVIREFGRRAFRDELTAEQVEVYADLFAGESSFDEGLHLVVSTMLQSPYLIYRRELGVADASHAGEFVLTPYELASELSYMLTDSPPDDQLLNRAAAGQLASQADLDEVALSLLASEAGRHSLSHFVHGWLEIDGLPSKAKDPSVFDLSAPLREAMLAETSEFFLELLQSGGTIGDLFGADFTMLNQSLAAFYGLSTSSSDSFARVSLAGQRPTGVLGHGSFLTMHALPDNSSPVQRGVRVRERLLCQDLPPIPENLDTNLATDGGARTNRERYAMHSQSTACSGCHQVIDPVGFAFEEYDAFGRFRETEGGSPVDATGELDGVVGGPVPLDGVQSINDFLSISDEVRACFIRFWSYYAYGRDKWQEKECTQDSIRAEAAESGYALCAG